MSQPRYLITGCGRSGTSFFASALDAAGLHCGHEEVFHVWGDNGKPFTYESSWYAAPFIAEAEGLTHVLHVVRQPEKVMASFYRIGLLSPSVWRHVTYGRPFRFWLRRFLKPGAAMNRIWFVYDHRRYFSERTRILEIEGEINRLDAYWTRWNTMIEAAAKERGVNYMRVRLEDFEAERAAIGDFIGLDAPLPMIAPTNAKTKYADRPMPDFALSQEAKELAERYGYDV